MCMAQGCQTVAPDNVRSARPASTSPSHVSAVLVRNACDPGSKPSVSAVLVRNVKLLRNGDAVAGPLMATKLFAPLPRRGMVARPRLLERLGRGAEARLTLVS